MNPPNSSVRLSVLIPSLANRKDSLEQLHACLNPQKTDEVEFIVVSDHGQMSIGQKRNMLLSQSRGQYVAFVDDDDVVPADYVSRILKALESNPDCTSLTGRITFSDGYSRPFIHSLRYDRWIDDHEGKVYYRPPNHLNAIRRDLAIKVGFPSWNSGEDRYFSHHIRPMLQREEWIEGTLYEYKCRKTFEETHNNQVKR
jgi:glycosyltransferase involved in cell wall biosynthesis